MDKRIKEDIFKSDDETKLPNAKVQLVLSNKMELIMYFVQYSSVLHLFQFNRTIHQKRIFDFQDISKPVML